MLYVRLVFLILASLLYISGNTQSITGNLSLLANQEIKLEGFNGLKTYAISKTTTDSKGNFVLQYSKSDFGVGYLMSSDNKPLFVILSGEDIELQGQNLINIETLQTLKGQENIWFEKYAQEHPKREQALSAWDYLDKIYTSDALFTQQQSTKQVIKVEKQRIKDKDAAFLASLPNDSYVRWFLPTRKLVSSVSMVAQHGPSEIPATIAAFRNMDYTDRRLYKSGLFKDAIESHFWLIENSGRSLDSVFIEMKYSIDAMMVYLVKDNKKFNEITDYLFNLLERHSHFKASEYLALKLLNETSCTIDSDLAKQLESYRSMKKGNTAPDMDFSGNLVAPGYASDLPKKLSDLKSIYTVVVFGASWCPKCTEELPEIDKLYAKWKSKGIEVVFVSLDENKETHHTFVKDFPFITSCDFQKWNSKIIKDYYVFATPTMYLLDTKREIVLRPNSVKQMDTWVDWNMGEENK